MIPVRLTPAMRHAALWTSDPWYRAAWLVGPQMLGLVAIGWLFATPHPADPPAVPGTWIHPTHSNQEDAELRDLRNQAVKDAGALARLQGKATGGNSLARFYLATLTDPKLNLLPPAPDNLAKSLDWYRKAADQGVDQAAVNLGLLLLIGDSLGIATDYAEARRLFERTAPTNAMGQRELGLMRQRGWGEPADTVGGMQLIRKAAERGDAFAQRLIGEAFERGESGLAVDPREAVLWLQKAALGGETVAQREFGTHLKTGVGIAADPTAALDWFRKAAAKGDGPAKAEVDAASPPLP